MNAQAFEFQSAEVGVYTLSTGRVAAILAVATGLVGLVLGGLALRAGPGHKGAVVALGAGVVAIAVGGLVVAMARGLGTGGGTGGGVVAVLVGVGCLVVGGLARGRALRW